MLKFGGWLEVYGEGVEQRRGVRRRGRRRAPSGKAAAAAQRRERRWRRQARAAAPLDEDDEALAARARPRARRSRSSTPPGVLTEQKFTQPPPRYNEGSLVRELEKRGIGRPSTYAEIISKVQARDYVEKLPSRRLQADAARQVRGRRPRHERSSTSWTRTSPPRWRRSSTRSKRASSERVALLKRFYKRFREQLDKSKKQQALEARAASRPTSSASECGSTMLKRWSKNGWFLGCANYPKCKDTQDLGQDGNGTARARRMTDFNCDKCGKPMIIKTGRYGEFLSCTGYPTCKNAQPVPLGVPCPKCGGDIIEISRDERGGRSFYGCSNYNAEHQVRLQALAEADPRAVPVVRREVPRPRRRQEEPDAHLPDRRTAATRSPSKSRRSRQRGARRASPLRATARKRAHLAAS